MTYIPKTRLYITVTVKNIDMKFKEIKDMTLAQIWEKVQKPFNFAWKAKHMTQSISLKTSRQGITRMEHAVCMSDMETNMINT